MLSQGCQSVKAAQSLCTVCSRLKDRLHGPAAIAAVEPEYQIQLWVWPVRHVRILQDYIRS